MSGDDVGFMPDARAFTFGAHEPLTSDGESD
jgi:hypothetical protein